MHRHATPPSRSASLLLAAALLAAASACGAEALWLNGSTATTGTSVDPDGALALVITDGGLAAVPAGGTRPVWTVAGAVAAPDGSAAAVHTAGELVHLDLRTGGRAGAAALPGTARVAAVAPGGHRVALAESDGHGGTTVTVWADGSSSTATFEGDLDPEAFTLDGHRLVAARSYGDHYRIVVLDLVGGQQYPSPSIDKLAPPEDMYGNVIQAVLTPDGRRLATLYRDPRHADHTAFVHLLDLESSTTVCIDLPAPFGTGGPATDTIAADGDTIEVEHDDGGGRRHRATFDTRRLLTDAPQRHEHAEVSEGDGRLGLPPGLAAVPGFRRLVAVVRPARRA